MKPMLLGKAQYTVRRRQPGQHVDGVWEQGAEETFEITASVQSPKQSQLNTMDEGWRESVRKVAYVTTPVDFRLVNGKEGHEPDLIEYDGEDLMLFGLQDLREGPLPHQVLALVTPELE